MIRKQQNDVNRAILTIAIDAVLTFIVFYFFDTICERGTIQSWAAGGGQCMPEWSYIAIPAFWLTSFLVSSAYDPKRVYKIVDEFQTLFMSVVLAFFLFSGFIFLFGLDIRRSLFLYFILADLVVLLGWRIIYRLYDRSRRTNNMVKSILIVGNTNSGRIIDEAIKNQSNKNLKVVGFLDDDNEREMLTSKTPVLGKTEKIKEIIACHHVDEVIFALPMGQFEKVVKLVLEIDDVPVRVRVIPSYFKLTYHRTRVENFYGIPLIGLRDPTLNEVQLLFKRIFDTVFASIGLLMIWPFLLLIAVLIRLDSKGPIIFKQIRIGENTQEFEMFKFRTMYNNYADPTGASAEVKSEEEAGKKAPDDPRVTPVGRFLRRTSLDEIPQLFNILRGDMSFVGPRPEMPWRVASYEPWQRVRFSVPQGLTGWWQINGRADNPMHLHTQDDLYYIENYSLWLDLQIILKTPLVVLRGKGAF